MMLFNLATAINEYSSGLFIFPLDGPIPIF